MMIALKDEKILIKDEDSVQKAIINSWGFMRRDRRTKYLVGDCSLELMNKLSTIVHLPPAIEKRRQLENAIRKRVDEERVKKDPKPLVHYPITKNLYEHQVRAANMALLTFQFVKPKEVQ